MFRPGVSGVGGSGEGVSVAVGGVQAPNPANKAKMTRHLNTKRLEIIPSLPSQIEKDHCEEQQSECVHRS
jgi:hypothetical protein